MGFVRVLGGVLVGRVTGLSAVMGVDVQRLEICVALGGLDLLGGGVVGGGQLLLG